MKTAGEMQDKQDRIVDSREESPNDPVLRAKDEMLGFLLGQMDSPIEAVSDPPTSDKEIDTMIQLVKDSYKDIPEFSYFGDPNWRIRDAEIEILEWVRGK